MFENLTFLYWHLRWVLTRYGNSEILKTEAYSLFEKNSMLSETMGLSRLLQLRLINPSGLHDWRQLRPRKHHSGWRRRWGWANAWVNRHTWRSVGTSAKRPVGCAARSSPHPPRFTNMSGKSAPLVLGSISPWLHHFIASLLQYSSYKLANKYSKQ